MPSTIWCTECAKYVDFSDKNLTPATSGFRDSDGSLIGLGRIVVRKCNKGHMLDLGTSIGMNGSLINRG